MEIFWVQDNLKILYEKCPILVLWFILIVKEPMTSQGFHPSTFRSQKIV